MTLSEEYREFETLPEPSGLQRYWARSSAAPSRDRRSHSRRRLHGSLLICRPQAALRRGASHESCVRIARIRSRRRVIGKQALAMRAASRNAIAFDTGRHEPPRPGSLRRRSLATGRLIGGLTTRRAGQNRDDGHLRGRHGRAARSTAGRRGRGACGSARAAPAPLKDKHAGSAGAKPP